MFFQLVNLPVEFNASSRAKAQLVELGIINDEELDYVDKVLDAAAWTYVAATLQSVLTLLYYVSLANRQQPAISVPIGSSRNSGESRPHRHGSRYLSPRSRDASAAATRRRRRCWRRTAG